MSIFRNSHINIGAILKKHKYYPKKRIADQKHENLLLQKSSNSYLQY
jgi:hypothetical protein